MIISFYDKNFKAIKYNCGLVIDKKSFKLIKRPVEMNDFTCVCEAITGDVQPMFLVVKDDKGSNNLVYASLAGIPILNKNCQTEINATDIKSMLSSDILVDKNEFKTVNAYITYVFNQWNEQVTQGSYPCELIFNSNVGEIELSDLKPEIDKVVEVNAWDEIQTYLKFYDLFMETSIDLVIGKIQFIIGKTMYRNMTIKLWEYGIKNYGKWIADTNESQGYYFPKDYKQISELTNSEKGNKWILTSDNQITLDENQRDIFPIKRKVFISSESLLEADKEALTILLDSLFNENIEISTNLMSYDFDSYEKTHNEIITNTLKPTFETKFAIYLKQGEKKYKDLPCGELHYDANGLTKIQIGYRYSDINNLFSGE